MENLNGKIVVITGSTRGFGLSAARAMLQSGATVVISGRSRTRLKPALDALGRLGPVLGRLCDVRREQQVYALARYAVKTFGRIDIWINNAGYASVAGPMLQVPPQRAIDMFLTNDMGTYYGAQAALHFMLPHREGTLVNLYGAGSFLRPASPTGLYATTKAWVTSFTRTLATEIKGSGVKLIGFSPGMLLTDMLLNPSVLGDQGRDMLERYPFVLRLLGRPPEAAAQGLIRVIATNQKEFAEVSLFHPWTILFSLLRIKWEDWTGKGSSPEFKLRIVKPYRPRI